VQQKQSRGCATIRYSGATWACARLHLDVATGTVQRIAREMAASRACKCPGGLGSCRDKGSAAIRPSPRGQSNWRHQRGT
jgi:hypothetical protein